MFSILHPTDFSIESQVALVHALRMALADHADLIILHVGQPDADEEFPSVREILQRWQMIPSGAPRSAVSDLGIGVEKIEAYGPTVDRAIGNYLDHHDADLLVMTTHGRQGLAAWLHPSMAEMTARQTDAPTLFVPAGGRGCVSVTDGSVSIRRILVPVDHQPSSDEAISRGLGVLSGLDTGNAAITLLHVGDPSAFPPVQLTADTENIEQISRTGTPAAEILTVAEELDADLIIMATEGRHGFLDALRGSTTENVLHGARCPLLAVPAAQ